MFLVTNENMGLCLYIQPASILHTFLVFQAKKASQSLELI